MAVPLGTRPSKMMGHFITHADLEAATAGLTGGCVARAVPAGKRIVSSEFRCILAEGLLRSVSWQVHAGPSGFIKMASQDEALISMVSTLVSKINTFNQKPQGNFFLDQIRNL